MVGADAEKETSKLALWPGPAEANRGGRLGREYDVVDGQTKGARYTAETQYSGRFAMEVTTRPHGRSHGGVMVRSGVEGSTEYGEECCQEGSPKRSL